MKLRILIGRRSACCVAKEEGVAALEFALVAPLFLCIMFGIILYGSYFMTRIAVTQAASEGARASVAGSTDAERKSISTISANNVLNSYGSLVSSTNLVVSPATSQVDPLSYTVTISYDFTSFGLSGLSAILPLPPAHTTVTSTAAFGGYP